MAFSTPKRGIYVCERMGMAADKHRLEQICDVSPRSKQVVINERKVI